MSDITSMLTRGYVTRGIIASVPCGDIPVKGASDDGLLPGLHELHVQATEALSECCVGNEKHVSM